MDGKMLVTYKILCEGDLNKTIKLQELLKNEKVIKAIKSEFAKGQRNISVDGSDSAEVELKTSKKLYTLEVEKDDFADLLSLAEDDAQNKKLLKKECSRIELVDIQTL